MPDAAAALDAYLQSRFGITLERAIADATADVCSLALRGDGVCEHYAGLISCQGVVYRFTCTTFTDASGARYVETIGNLEVVRWEVRLVVQHQQSWRG